MVQGLIELLLILVISIYLLLDGPRISRKLDRVFPPGPTGYGSARRCREA